MQGWLAKTPSSWLHLLIRLLPARDKLALFQTCRHLSKQVARWVGLRLAEPRQTGKIEAQRKVVTSLLVGCASLHVELCTDQPQPFPLELSSSITEVTLRLHWRSKEPASTSFDWGRLQNLHTVTFQERANLQDVSRLCDAVQAGQLPALHSLIWCTEHTVGHNAQAVYARLTAAVGKQLTHLTTNCGLLLLHLGQLAVLESVIVCESLYQECLKQLCSHPTLHSVTLKGEPHHHNCYREFLQEGDYSQLECKWNTVTFQSISAGVIASLPLANVRSIKIVREVPPDIGDREDMRVLQEVLDKHAGKLVCMPDGKGLGDVFCLGSCTKSELQLLQLMRGVCKLRLGPLKSFDVLSKLYLDLPSCVCCIEMKSVFGDFDTLLVYRGLPVHVKHMQFTSYGFDFEQLLNLVVRAPTHVHKLTFNWGNTDTACLLGAWYDALLAAAPGHLSVMFNTWH